MWQWRMVSWYLENMKFSSARWCQPFLRGCEPGLVRNRPLNGCWAGCFSSTSLSFSSLCSRGATLLPSCSDLSINSRVETSHFFWLLLRMVPSSCRWYLIPCLRKAFLVSYSISCGRVFQRSLSCTGGLDKSKGESQRWMQRHIKVNQKLSLTIVREWLWWAPLNIHVWFSSVTSCTRHYVEVCILCMTITWALHVEEIFKRRGWKLDEEQSLSWDRKWRWLCGDMLMRDHAPSTLQ